MKTTVRVVALMLVLTMTVFMFAACGNKPSGEYYAKVEVMGQSSETTLKFSGNKVTTTTNTTIAGYTTTETSEGTFEIVENDNGDLQIVVTVDGEKSPAISYEKGDDYIKIGGVQYNKK